MSGNNDFLTSSSSDRLIFNRFRGCCLFPGYKLATFFRFFCSQHCPSFSGRSSRSVFWPLPAACWDTGGCSRSYVKLVIRSTRTCSLPSRRKWSISWMKKWQKSKRRKNAMSAKNRDRHNRFRSITVGFRVSPEEQEQLNRAGALSGLPKQEYC